MKYIRNLIIRVIIASIIILIPFNIFYFLFSDITLYGSLPILKLIGYSFYVEGYSLVIEDKILDFVPACVATSAYSLLALLILLSKNMKLKKGILMFISGALLILIMNIIRIDLQLYILLEFGKNYFDKVHLFFWHIVSSVYVAGVWIYLTYKFKLKSIPVYSDLKYLLEKSKPRKRKHKSKKRKHKRKTKRRKKS